MKSDNFTDTCVYEYDDYGNRSKMMATAIKSQKLLTAKPKPTPMIV